MTELAGSAAGRETAFAERLRGAVGRVAERVRIHYRNLHRFPELSWNEERTAAYVEGVLSELGLSPRRVGRTGVVADVSGPAEYPVRALRADMDAVAVSESTGLPHSSENAGVMHACGHDAHTAILLGAADVLVELEELRPRPLRLVFQPAEESSPSGAPMFIDEGVLDGVADIIGLHVWPSLATGKIGLRDGVVTAASDRWECVVRGPGGHSARPHETIDLVPLVSRMVTDLVDVPRRVCDPLRQPVVVTATRFHAGEAINVIPSMVRFGGTVRSLESASRDKVAAAMAGLVKALAAQAGAEIEWSYECTAPMLSNAPALAGELRELAKLVLGDGTLEPIASPSLGSEDFAYFAAEVPALLLRLGSTAPGDTPHPLHSPHFRVDEAALPLGVTMLAGLALRAAKSS